MINKRIGKQSIRFENPPYIISSAAIAGEVEGEGPLGSFFDTVLSDDTWGEDSFEKCERKMFESSVRTSLDKLNMLPDALDCLLGGDLLDQIISASFAARELMIPYLGLYGACSTMAESMLLGAILIDGGYARKVACASSSHFCTAERQYRFPLEMGVQTTPTSQRTVTGAGCLLLSADDGGIYSGIRVTGATIGRVIDLGIADANNMGAAMAPAAADTLVHHLKDNNISPDKYDLIITGDLGSFGSRMLLELCTDKGVDIAERHIDCGNAIYLPAQNYDCGGSGCGCSAIVLCSYLLGRMEHGDFKRALFIATGALMSPTSGMQSDSIPSIAHAVAIERR